MRRRVATRSFHRGGTLLPPHAAHFKGRAIRLSPGQAIEWHSTRRREEVLLVFRGAISLERCSDGERIRTMTLSAGRLAFIPAQTWHRVVNRSRRQAHYIYLTA